MEQVSTLDNAYQIADRWAGDILGAARVPELCRYVAQLGNGLADDQLFDAAAYFAGLNFVGSFPSDTLRAVVAKTRTGMPMKAIAEQLAQPADMAAVLPSKPDNADHRVMIRFSPEDLPRHADEAERAIVKAPGSRIYVVDEEQRLKREETIPADLEQVFSHGGAYAVIRPAKPVTPREMRSKDDAPPTIFHLADRESLRQRLMASCKFYRWTKDRGAENWTPDMACDLVVNNLLARRGGMAPPLTGLQPTPTITENGRIIEAPGYDPATGLFCTFKVGEFPKIKTYLKSSAPTGDADLDAARLNSFEREFRRAKYDAVQAYRFLATEVFGEFIFADPADEAAAVAALLTALVRKTCGIAPAFLGSAALQGVGKTTLLNAIGFIAEGAAPAIAPWPDNDDELRKQLTALCLTGRSAIIFDNVRNGAVVDSPTLARFLTAEAFADRVLGKSETVNISTAVFISLTGNNPILAGDMPSRILAIRLDAEDERPDKRQFKRDLLEWVRAHRPQVVEQALTLIKAWLDVGKPGPTATRFPTWDCMVRQAIMFAGGPDISSKFDRSHEDDPIIGQLQELAAAWRPALGDSPVSAGEIVSKVTVPGDFSEAQGNFRRVLTDLVADGRGVKLTPRAVGLRLKKFADRPIGDMRIVSRYSTHSKTHVWSLVEKGGKP